MFHHDTQIRVRYGDTDKMGVVYYGKYAEYFEVGRTELIRQFGLTYRGMEESGILLPVLILNVQYIKPARYDDLITIRAWIRELPQVRIKFDYEIFSQNMELLCKGETTLAFTDSTTWKPRRAPADFIEQLQTKLKNS